MAHFAKVHKETKEVLSVVVINNNILDPENTGVEDESLGIAYCQELWGDGVDYVQTSYNHSIRAHFASVGATYDEVNDIFVEPKPFNSWILDTTTGQWNAPIAHPTNYSDINGNWHWDETAYINDTSEPKTLGWVEGQPKIEE